MWLIDSIFDKPANGYFVNDLLVFGGLHAGGFVSKGYIFEPPDLSNAQISDLNDFQSQLSLLLASLGEAQRLQVQWSCDCDYKAELLRYDKETRKASNTWTRRVRNERFTRYWNAMLNRELRRQRLILYISRRIDASTPTGGDATHYEHLLDQLQQEFAQVHETITGIFNAQGARVVPMNDADHYRHITNFLNPSLSARFDHDQLDTFDPFLSIQANCWHSEGTGQTDFGFFMDGHYHSMIVLTRWPKVTFPGIIQRLTNLRLLDYAITVNVDPIPVRDEIAKEERAHERLAGDYASERKLSLLTAMQKKERKIAALSQGNTLPFNALFAIRVWDKTKEGLSAKTGAIKSAINSMNGAQYFESTLPSSTKKLFFQTWPGWLWGRYEYRKLYAEHQYLCDMLPVSATFTGHLATAEALYDGNAANLVGVKTFAGVEGKESPQHAVLLGMSGSGKSVLICDLLAQTEGYFDYTVLIEEGLSYGVYTKTVDPNAEPIILQPDGLFTINYLDTNGLPLTSQHLSSAVALLSRMIGGGDEEKQLHRQAQMGRFLNQLYEDSYQEWRRRNPSKLLKVARHACALAAFRRERLSPGSTSLDVFVDFRDWQRTCPDESFIALAGIADEEVLRYLKEPETAKDVRNLAFSYFGRSEFPIHRRLQELVELEARRTRDNELRGIADLLAQWCRGGGYGTLFDGESNVSLTGKIAHFELGYIPDDAQALKSAACFLITSYTRQHIISMPRALRKRNVYEEVARFLDTSDGERIVKEGYAQMRKFNCWNISVVQQYSRFRESRIRSAVFGNSRQFFMMRQSDRSDVEAIGRDIGLPEVTQNAIMSYALPDQQSGQKLGAMTYYHLDAIRPICGTLHNIASPEMLYCSDTSGEHFDERCRELKGHSDIVKGIVTNVAEKSNSQ